MVNLKEQVFTDLRLRAMISNNELVNQIANQCQCLSTEQILFIQNTLGVASVRAISNTLSLTPQQFEAARIKHG